MAQKRRTTSKAEPDAELDTTMAQHDSRLTPPQPETHPESGDEGLLSLYQRWEQLKADYADARARNAQQHMSNLRGLMLTIQREIGERGGEMPEFPYSDQQRRRAG